MTATLLTLLFLTFTQAQKAPTISAPDVGRRLDRELTSKYCRIQYTENKEQDARQLADYADRSLSSMSVRLGLLDPALMDNFNCTILQFATPQPSLADDRTANSHTEDRGRLIEVSILASSSFSPTSRTVVGEPKDSDYVFNLVANELSTVLFERITRDKGNGWYFHDAPQWFVQGIEGYSGLVYSSAHYREITLPKYIAEARARSNEITFDDGVHVQNPYVGGVALVAFLYDAYGENHVNSLLKSPATTFDEAFAATFGDWKSVEAEYRDWVASPARADRDTYQEEADRLATLLNWHTGDVVAEIGAKKGQLTLAAAQRVGSTGRVYSTELDVDALAHLGELATKQKNIIVVKAAESETNLPATCCDSIFMRLVYHHLTKPAEIDASLFQSLKPGGRLAVIDEGPSKGSIIPDGVPANRVGHGIPQQVLISELVSAGFEVEAVANDWPHDEFHQMYCVVFRKKKR